WIEESGVKNVLAPIAIDVSAADWSIAPPFDALVAINMIHISPWAATLGLVAGAQRLLTERGVLYTYGPYRDGGRHIGPSNEAVDASLKARNPEWGVRDVDDVEAAANKNGLELREV